MLVTSPSWAIPIYPYVCLMGQLCRNADCCGTLRQRGQLKNSRSIAGSLQLDIAGRSIRWMFQQAMFTEGKPIYKPNLKSSITFPHDKMMVTCWVAVLQDPSGRKFDPHGWLLLSQMGDVSPKSETWTISLSFWGCRESHQDSFASPLLSPLSNHAFPWRISNTMQIRNSWIDK